MNDFSILFMTYITIRLPRITMEIPIIFDPGNLLSIHTMEPVATNKTPVPEVIIQRFIFIPG